MTSNQIAYWVNEEKKRSNLAQEAEQYRHNLEQEKIGYQQAAASLIGARASAMNASTQAAALRESSRHNLAMEKLSGAEVGIKGFTSVANALLGAGELGVKEGQLEIAKEKLPYEQANLAASAIDKGASGAKGLFDVAGGVVNLLGLLGGI